MGANQSVPLTITISSRPIDHRSLHKHVQRENQCRASVALDERLCRRPANLLKHTHHTNVTRYLRHHTFTRRFLWQGSARSFIGKSCSGTKGARGVRRSPRRMPNGRYSAWGFTPDYLEKGGSAPSARSSWGAVFELQVELKGATVAVRKESREARWSPLAKVDNMLSSQFCTLDSAQHRFV